jgi:hypothetical protein
MPKTDNDESGFAMAQTPYVLWVAVVAALPAFAFACRSEPSSGAASKAVTSAGAESAVAPASPGRERESDEIKPVYPRTQDPPEPAAERYCNLMYEVSESKRAECCPSMPFSVFRPTDECVRTLSYALRSKAVTLEKADLDACEAAIMEEAKHCDWSGATPAVCEGIVRGQIGEREVCRSSLECKDGLRCAGLGATKPGKCFPALPVGAPCGAGVDTLGAFIHQDPERTHPECDGYCDRRRCAASVEIGGACKTSLQCGFGRRCQSGHCTAAPLPSAGEACGAAPCATGTICLRGTCVAPKRLGEACAGGDECRSGDCEIADGGERQCSMNCEIIRTKPGDTGAPSAPQIAPKR